MLVEWQYAKYNETEVWSLIYGARFHNSFVLVNARAHALLYGHTMNGYIGRSYIVHGYGIYFILFMR